MWFSSGMEWGLCVFHPDFFYKHLLTMMDLSSLMTGYICGVINVVVFLQWAQVYRVIKNPERANQTFVTNWAVKMESIFVLVFTILTIASIYASMYDHFREDDKGDSALDVTKATLQVVNSMILFIVILFYIGLLVLFQRLIKLENEVLAPLKYQLNVFFFISITAMTLKLCAIVTESVISFKNDDKDIVLDKTLLIYFAILGGLNIVSDLSFSGLILSYLMTSAEKEREIRATMEKEEQEKLQ